MESEIFKIAASQGIWTVLSVFLLFYILRSQDKINQLQSLREEKFQQIILELTKKLDIIEEIKLDVKEIKNSKK